MKTLPTLTLSKHTALVVYTTIAGVMLLAILVASIFIQANVNSAGASAPCNVPGEAHPLPFLQPCFK